MSPLDACPHCGSQNSPVGRFCAHCGHDLQHAKIAVKDQDAPLAQTGSLEIERVPPATMSARTRSVRKLALILPLASLGAWIAFAVGPEILEDLKAVLPLSSGTETLYSETETRIPVPTQMLLPDAPGGGATDAADTSTTRATIPPDVPPSGEDIDWHVGPLSGVFWNMPRASLPPDLALSPGFAPSGGYSRLFLESMIESKAALVWPLAASADYRFHGVRIRAHEFIFFGEVPGEVPDEVMQILFGGVPDEGMQWRTVSEPGPMPRPEDYGLQVERDGLRGAARDFDRYYAAEARWEAEWKRFNEEVDSLFRHSLRLFERAERSSRLIAFYLYPDEAEPQTVRHALSNAFGEGPNVTRSYYPLPSGGVQWDAAEWRDDHSILTYADVTQAGRSLTHVIIAVSSSGETLLSDLLTRLHWGPGSSDAELPTVLLQELSSRNWLAGSGFIRQRLGSGVELPAGITVPSGPYFAYPLSIRSIAADARLLVFYFDESHALIDVRVQPDPIGNPRPSYHLPSIGASVSSVRLYETAGGGTPQEQRVYTHQFSGPEARYISMEIELSYPPPGRPVELVWSCTYHRPNGTTFEQERRHRIESSWAGSWHTIGIGWSEPGNWRAGRYLVECSMDGSLVFRETFKVTMP